MPTPVPLLSPFAHNSGTIPEGGGDHQVAARWAGTMPDNAPATEKKKNLRDKHGLDLLAAHRRASRFNVMKICVTSTSACVADLTCHSHRRFANRVVQFSYDVIDVAVGVLTPIMLSLLQCSGGHWLTGSGGVARSSITD